MTSQTDALDIENVVVSTDLEREFDLQALADSLPRTRYDPERFPGLFVRTGAQDVSVTLFRSGKVVCTGVRSDTEAATAVDSVLHELRTLGIAIEPHPDLTVQNIVATGGFDERLNLHAVALGLGLATVEYEPEQFPGLVYRVDDPAVVVLLFASGSLVVTGAKTIEEARQAQEAVRTRLADLGLLGGAE